MIFKVTKLAFEGRVIGPLLALVCPCFRKNVIVTCKMVSFSYSLDNFVLKDVIVFNFGKHILQWRPFEERTIFDSFFTFFFCHQAKDRKIHSAHILRAQNTYFAPPFDFFALPILQKKIQIYLIWFLFGTPARGPLKCQKGLSGSNDPDDDGHDLR